MTWLRLPLLPLWQGSPAGLGPGGPSGTQHWGRGCWGTGRTWLCAAGAGGRGSGGSPGCWVRVPGKRGRGQIWGELRQPVGRSGSELGGFWLEGAAPGETSGSGVGVPGVLRVWEGRARVLQERSTSERG